MAQGGDEQAATRALAEAAQERQGRMFDTHHQFVKQNETAHQELMRRLAAEQDLAFRFWCVPRMRSQNVELLVSDPPTTAQGLLSRFLRGID